MDEWRGSKAEGKRGRKSEKHHSLGKELFCIYCFEIKILLHLKTYIKKLSKLSLIKLKYLWNP